MFVPSYVPPQIEIPDSVSEEKYMVRLGFIKRVLGLHLGSIVAVAAVAAMPRSPVPIQSAAASVAAILVAMIVLRRLAKGRRIEVVVSAGMLIPFLISLGVLLGELSSGGIAVWPFAIALGSMYLYGFLCGRDFSFIALFLIPFFVSSAAWIALFLAGLVEGWGIELALVSNTALILYLVYDLAALLTRRRMGEELGAVADLYRDCLNFTTYWIRVARHWRRYPLWQR